jgi:hypothetical protein
MLIAHCDYTEAEKSFPFPSQPLNGLKWLLRGDVFLRLHLGAATCVKDGGRGTKLFYSLCGVWLRVRSPFFDG